jgi:hypothetical protein
MNEVIKFGLADQMRVLKLYLKDYEKELCGGIISSEEYNALKKYSESIYERLTLESINQERDKEVELWLRNKLT